jgi:hypothetical protein
MSEKRAQILGLGFAAVVAVLVMIAWRVLP